VISTLGGRVPRARAEPPRENHSAGSQRLRFPVGVATRRYNHSVKLSYSRIDSRVSLKSFMFLPSLLSYEIHLSL